MKKNNQEIENPFSQVRTPFSKHIIDSIKAEYKKLFTVKEFSKAITFLICFCFALEVTNFYVPLLGFLVKYGETALEALIVYYLLYPFIWSFIYISTSVFAVFFKFLLIRFLSFIKQ